MKSTPAIFLFLLVFYFTACNESASNESPEATSETTETATETEAEVQEQTCARKSDYVPEGWKIVKETKGDLNKDGKPDLVLVIQSTDPKKIEKDEYFTVDSNPRTLLILFATDDEACYELNTESRTFILPHTDMNMEDPFSEVEIKNGTLRLKFVQFANAGSWESGAYTYVWRHQDGDFKLIGANSSEYHRASGEAYDVSVNFSTGKYSLKSYNMFDEEVEEKEEWKQLKNKSLQTFKTFPLPWSWKVNEDIYI